MKQYWIEYTHNGEKSQTIDRLYDLLRKLESRDPDVASALRWAIFELERRPRP